MTYTSSKYIVPLDFNDVSMSALHFAVELAKHNGDEIVLVHFVDNEHEIRSAKVRLNNIIENLDTDIKYRITFKVFEGKVLQDLGKIAVAMEGSLIIIGTRGERGLQKVFGSNTLRMISNSKVPFVVIQKETRYQDIDKIAMTIDLEKESVQVARAAAVLGHKLDAEVILIGGNHKDSNLRRTVLLNAKIAKDYLEEFGVRTQVELLDKDDFEANLINYCKDNGVDMIAATFYPFNFYPISDKFVQRLIENELFIPVITIDSEAIGVASPISFFTAV